MDKSPGLVRRLFGFLWRVVDVSRRIIFNLVFLFLVLLVIVSLFVAREDEEVPEEAALVLAPAGDIVEQLTYVPPAVVLFREGVDEEQKDETLLRDLIEAVDLAREDARIKALVLDLDRMERAGLSKLQEIGAALDRFREGGKTIVACGDYYTQNQYYLAAHADEVYLHPLGGVLLTGYGIYRAYFKSALEKLLVQVHAFRVGTFKSALEPFLRDDMSPEAREANLAWLNVLWQAFKEDVAGRRRLPAAAIDDYINGIVEHLDEVGGDMGRLAVEKGLVDGLKTRDQVRQRLVELVGEGEEGQGYRQIRFDRYLRLARPSPELAGLLEDKVGVIVARGVIVNGKQPAGTIGGDSMAELLRRAREDEDIGAVVLRVDSGGGSAFAAEIVRQEVELTRSAGKPVVVSMSSVAASGGYWLAVAADEIWAAPTTITGAIGIYGAIPTFEKSLDALGIHADGVGTTELAGGFDLRRPLHPLVAGAMQQVVERGYRRFVELVAAGRGMSPEAVEEIARGRAWAGETALELGLVDGLGGMQEAIEAAARLAGLDEYEVVYVEKPLTPREQLLRMLATRVGDFLGEATHPALRMLDAAGREAAILARMNDPQGVYAWCLTCQVQ